VCGHILQSAEALISWADGRWDDAQRQGGQALSDPGSAGSRMLARWATVLLAVGGLVSAALTVMPDAFYRLLAYPNGIAMIALGVSLWRTTTTSARQPVAVTR